MAEPEVPNQRPRPSRAPAAGVRMMILVLIVFGLMAIYGNVQKLRRDRIESVTVSRSTPTPTPSPQNR